MRIASISLFSILMIISTLAWPQPVKNCGVTANTPRTEEQAKCSLMTISRNVFRMLNREARKDPDLAGMMVFTINRLSSGKVESILTKEDTMKNTSIENAIKKQIKQLDFGQSADGILSIDYRRDFK